MAPGQIYNSNPPLLAALLGDQGGVLVDPGPVPDRLEATRDARLETARDADIIVSTGGVSVGDEDHIRAAATCVGHLDPWRVRMKPGKPVAFGRVHAAAFLGLPGNPVSAWVTAHLFLLPLSRRLQGQSDPVFPDCAYARLERDWPQARPRREFLRVRLRREPGQQRRGRGVLLSARDGGLRHRHRMAARCEPNP